MYGADRRLNVSGDLFVNRVGFFKSPLTLTQDYKS